MRTMFFLLVVLLAVCPAYATTLIDEGFEETTFLPLNWSTETTDSFYSWMRDNIAHNSDAAARIGSWDGAVFSASLISPPLDLSGYEYWGVTFWYKHESVPGLSWVNVEIRVNGGVWIPLMPGIAYPFNVWEKVELTPPMGADKLIEIRWQYVRVFDVFPRVKSWFSLDDVLIWAIPQCDDGCVLSGECYPVGYQNPDNSCQVCDPIQIKTEYSPADGAACDDGSWCSVNDTCDGIYCKGQTRSCDDGLFCNGTEFCNDATESCMEADPPCNEDDVCDELADTCGTDTTDDDDEDDSGEYPSKVSVPHEDSDDDSKWVCCG
jgi:hypothetical protein